MTARLLLSLALLSSPALGSEWIVSRGGGGHFTDLQVAIDTVAPGDTLLIKGTQRGRAKQWGRAPFTVTKSLTIRGMGPSSTIQGGTAEQGADATALVIDAGAGSSVVLEGLLINGGREESWGMNGADGIRVLNVGTLAVARCTVLAGENYVTNAWDWHGDIQEGIEVRSADRVVVRDSTVRGGEGCFSWGYQGVQAYPSNGGAAVNLSGARVALIDGCDVTGGDGGDCVLNIPWTWDHYFEDQPGTDGGAGILVGGCDEVLVLGGKQSGGARGEYLIDWSDPDTWLGFLWFDPGLDGLAIDGDVKRSRN